MKALQKIIFYARGMATMLLIASLALNFYFINNVLVNPAGLERMQQLAELH